MQENFVLTRGRLRSLNMEMEQFTQFFLAALEDTNVGNEGRISKAAHIDDLKKFMR